MTDAFDAVERAVRDSYGRLIAFLAARSDMATAEDALADALVAALETWPTRGVPDRPEAWLLTAARRRLIDAARHERARRGADASLRRAAQAAHRRTEEPMFPDERLALLLGCAHPAVPADTQTPLMLQVALGLDAARIASAFLVSPAAMGQRLARAKAALRNAGATFEPPDAADLTQRIGPVLAALYAAYGTGWDDVAGADPRRRGLAHEALHLARLVADLTPTEPEANGLAALMLHCEARRTARRARGRYVPLAEQSPDGWSLPMQLEAEARLRSASALGRLGRYQLEAAIQSAHAARRFTGSTDWEAIAQLAEGLARMDPTVGTLIGRAAAVAELHGANVGLAALAELPEDVVVTFQPYWALRGHLLRRAGRMTEAAAALERAIGLSEDPAVRAFLTRWPG